MFRLNFCLGFATSDCLLMSDFTGEGIVYTCKLWYCDSLDGLAYTTVGSTSLLVGRYSFFVYELGFEIITTYLFSFLNSFTFESALTDSAVWTIDFFIFNVSIYFSPCFNVISSLEARFSNVGITQQTLSLLIIPAVYSALGS